MDAAVETSAGTAPPLPAPRDRMSLLGSLAGITAVTAGAIYTYGALTKMTVLWGADQKVADTLPLFSLEQLLLAGISELMQLGLWLLLLATIVILAGDIFEHGARRRKATPRSQPGTRQGRSRSRIRNWSGWPYVAYVGASLLLLVLVLTADLSSLIAIAAGGAAFFYGRMLKVSRVRGVLGLSLLLATIIFVSNYFAPEPLPTVELAVQNSRAPVKGTLITRTDESWYVAIGQDRFEVIPAAQVTKASVHSRQQSEDTTLFEWVTGDKFLGLPRE
jgi:hypothetical protein